MPVAARCSLSAPPQVAPIQPQIRKHQLHLETSMPVYGYYLYIARHLGLVGQWIFYPSSNGPSPC
jgi:hypothetical protein